ncbi:MAG: RNA polymerase sigma factor, partial [Gemmatimonadota bacterium]
MGDAGVVRLVLDGDRDRFRVLVDRYAPMVFSVVRRWAREPAEAEDLAQEIFVRAYEGLKEFRGEASFSSWLYRIAVNRCRDHVKSAWHGRESLEALQEAGGHGKVSPGRVPAIALGGAETPETELERTERAARVRWALDQLAPDHAVAFLLKYEQELTYEEMAGMLDSTAGALKVRVH